MKPDLQQFWRKLKDQEEDIVREVKTLIAKEIDKGCFS
jgi:hypothetical protein